MIFGESVSIYCPSDVPAIQFARGDLQQALVRLGTSREILPDSKIPDKQVQTQFVIGLSQDDHLLNKLLEAGGTKATNHWRNYAAIGSKQYKPQLFRKVGWFSWQQGYVNALREFTIKGKIM